MRRRIWRITAEDPKEDLKRVAQRYLDLAWYFSLTRARDPKVGIYWEAEINQEGGEVFAIEIFAFPTEIDFSSEMSEKLRAFANACRDFAKEEAGREEAASRRIPVQARVTD